MIRSFCLLTVFGTLFWGCKVMDNQLIFQSKEFKVYRDSVVQGPFTARALSRQEIVSDYKSPALQFKDPVVKFKFSINGADNAAPAGNDNSILCAGGSGSYVTPVITFGKSFQDSSKVAPEISLGKKVSLTLRVDMNRVLSSFKSKGYYVCFDGTKIYKDDFKGVYVAGNTAPLTWDFNNLYSHKELEMQDPDGDGIYEITLLLNSSPDEHTTASSWKLSRDISSFPQYLSPDRLTDALYNLSLEEMINAIEPDSTFRTGKEWSGVWTRDISYSIILSMGMLQPKVAMISLKRKVKNGKIVQDTGTGGAYPVSTDREIWGVAAWEVYLVTGDKNWLEYAYTVLKNSMEDDLNNLYDPVTGLVKGESSFLDWREQTYPVWMQPADIYESECLGTNAVHFQAGTVLGEMAVLLGHEADAATFKAVAEKIKSAINRNLWIPQKGYYGQFLYGRNDKILSPRAEALGEALSVIFNIADTAMQQQIGSSVPVTTYGISCIYPQIPGIPPYHNNAVWPFVESFWAQACARAGNEKGVVRSISSVIRPAALFLTNKENFVASDGDYAGTQINSSNMLWSLSGNISLIYKVLFGMRLQADGLDFEPFVPEIMKGKRTLRNFKYRDALLDIEMEGYGNSIRSFLIDEKSTSPHRIPATLQGKHSLKMVLADNSLSAPVNVAENRFSPQCPVASYEKGMLSWEDTGRIASYKILLNGKVWKETSTQTVAVDTTVYGNYQVIAIDGDGTESFASEPLLVYPHRDEQLIQMERFAPSSVKPFRGFQGTGFVEINKQLNRELTFTAEVDHDGDYLLDIRYANGNGPVNTENKCAFRSILVDHILSGTLVFPQRGKEQWSNWGWSNSIKISLKKGLHHLTLRMGPSDENMNGAVNQAMLDCARLISR